MKKKRRTIYVSDGDWERVRFGALKSGMPAGDYLVSFLSPPKKPKEKEGHNPEKVMPDYPVKEPKKPRKSIIKDLQYKLDHPKEKCKNCGKELVFCHCV